MDWNLGAWKCSECKTKAETWWATQNKVHPLRCSGGKKKMDFVIWQKGEKMKIGDEVYIHGYVDEIRKDVVIIRNNGGYFGTDKSEIIVQPEEDCNTCVHGYFGDSQCFNCRVSYPSHYERITDEQTN